MAGLYEGGNESAGSLKAIWRHLDFEESYFEITMPLKKKTQNNRQILVEQHSIRAKCLQYLRKIKKYREEGSSIFYMDDDDDDGGGGGGGGGGKHIYDVVQRAATRGNPRVGTQSETILFDAGVVSGHCKPPTPNGSGKAMLQDVETEDGRRKSHYGTPASARGHAGDQEEDGPTPLVKVKEAIGQAKQEIEKTGEKTKKTSEQ
ncbi:hypothetical protein ANN_17542 [Periplaneta americana]|uniref:Uncharacterized protein n=1 Tax=Periplaneta americana TaxID=6978 RepID=A0ABQ8ST79_PERAM|nr:hypothetical protein ANN_17542 [Periplaneta americana]